MNSDVQNKGYIHFTSVEIYSMSLDALNPGRHLSADKKVCGSSENTAREWNLPVQN